MLLLQVIVFTLVDISSSYTNQDQCYGSTYTFSPPQSTSIYYKPRTREERILVVQEGQSKHERFEASFWYIKMKDLTEQDDGATLFFDNNKGIQLTITDCQTPETNYYGGVFSLRVPSSAEYLEFAQVVSHDSALKPVVMWNRTDPSSSSGAIKRNYFEIYDLNQKNSGYYNFRGSKNQLIKWKRLSVEENHRHFERTEGDYLDMDFPVKFQLDHINFLPDGSDIEMTIGRDSMRRRMEVTESYFTLRDLKYEDTGTYKFIDNDGNVAMRVQLEVRIVETPTWAYIVIVAVIILGIFTCCCCVRKCCCKKSSSKRNNSGSTGPAVTLLHYHDSNQPVPPTVTLLSREPRGLTADATTYNAAGRSLDPPPFTQTTVTGDLGPTSHDVTSCDSDPKFELKWSVFPSALPLSSHTSIQDVYTSDKLNFL